MKKELSPESRAELDELREEIRREIDRRWELEREARLWGEQNDHRSASELAREGWWDTYYGEWVPPETTGIPMAGVEADLTPQRAFVLSPERLLTAVVYLAEASRSCPAILRAATRLPLHRCWVVRDGFRHVVVDSHVQAPDDGPDVMRWLHRDPSDARIKRDWLRDDDELAFLEQLRDEGRDDVSEALEDFRARKLVRLLTDLYGPDWRLAEMVTRWGKTRDGRFFPEERMTTVQWIDKQRTYHGSLLFALGACIKDVQKRLVRRQLAR